MLSNFRYVNFATVIILLVICQACATFPGNKIPKTGYPDLTTLEKLEPIEYEVMSLVQGKQTARENTRLKRIVENVFRESNLFETCDQGFGGSENHLRIKLDNYGNMGLAFCSGFISGYTLLVVPGYARDNFTLTVEVNSGNALLKNYQYNDYMSTWIGWIFLPVMPWNFPTSIYDEVISNMFRKFLQDLAYDGLLVQEQPPSPVLPSDVELDVETPPIPDGGVEDEMPESGEELNEEVDVGISKISKEDPKNETSESKEKVDQKIIIQDAEQ